MLLFFVIANILRLLGVDLNAAFFVITNILWLFGVELNAASYANP